MDPNQPPVGRARGRGRGLFQHPTPFHSKDGHPGVSIRAFSIHIFFFNCIYMVCVVAYKHKMPPFSFEILMRNLFLLCILQPQREPWSLPSGPPRPPAPQPGRQIVGVKHSSSEDSQTKGRGGCKFRIYLYTFFRSFTRTKIHRKISFE